MASRACTHCGEVKPEEAFYATGRSRRHRRGMCGRCRSAQIQAQKAAKGVRWAHKQLDYAIEKGDMVRPAVCQDCGASARVDAHHTDYSRPLDVVWVCRSCHRNRHSEEAGLRTRVDMRLDNELLERLDGVRGEVSRTRFVENALKAYMGRKSASRKSPEPVAGSQEPAKRVAWTTLSSAEAKLGVKPWKPKV